MINTDIIRSTIQNNNKTHRTLVQPVTSTYYLTKKINIPFFEHGFRLVRDLNQDDFPSVQFEYQLLEQVVEAAFVFQLKSDFIAKFLVMLDHDTKLNLILTNGTLFYFVF